MKHHVGRCAQESQSLTQAAVLFLMPMLVVMPLTGAMAAEENNVHLYGALVAEACVILPGDDNIPLDFGSIVAKYLYQNTRTQGKPFEIRLAECDLSLGRMVTVSFRGPENSALPGLLAMGGGSQATGIAIGLESAEGKPLPLNQKSGQYTLQDGSNIIALKAYVQGEPAAIADKAIGYGQFNALATFNLAYE